MRAKDASGGFADVADLSTELAVCATIRIDSRAAGHPGNRRMPAGSRSRRTVHEGSMAMKSILARVYGGEADRAALDAALRIARAFRSHLDVLYVPFDTRAATPIMTDFGVGPDTALIWDTLERTARERTERARLWFEAWRTENQVPSAEAHADDGVSARWRAADEPEEDAVAHRGRLADLIVVGQPAAEPAVPSQASLEAAVFRTRRPVLMAPGTPSGRPFERALIAWNGSAEASAAVALSLPVLSLARSVSVFTAAEEKHRGEAEELIDYLRRHGIAAERAVARDTGSTAADLLAAAEGVEAGLIVMGAYGHSRMRETLFGGVTRHMVDHSPIPVLMAH